MSLSLKNIEEIHSYTDSDNDSDSLSVSSDEFDYQADNIEIAGEILKGQYAIIKKIGKGSYANVWLAYDIMSNSYVAIKVQHPDNFKEGVEEINFLRRIKPYRCEFINNLLDAFIEVRRENKQKKKYICMVCELLAGNLYDIIQEGTYAQGLPLATVRSISVQLFKGLNIMHNELKAYHADLKPENILIKGVSRKNQEIIDAYTNLDFQSEYKKNREEVLKLKNVDPQNKAKVKKVLTSKLKKRIKNKIHKDFMQKLENFILDDSSSSDEEEFSSDEEVLSEDEEEVIVLSDDDSENESEDSDDDSEISIEDKIDIQYIETCNIKISDFGSICYDGEEFEDDFGTRYYRAPEIILGHIYDKSCDIWSLGCVIFELLTGDLLFDPKKDKENNRDMQHLYWIQQLCGKFSKSFLNKCDKRKMFFDKKNNLPKIAEIQPWKLSQVLKENYNLEGPEIDKIIDLLDKMLIPEPKKRIDVKSCLNHPFIKG